MENTRNFKIVTISVSKEKRNKILVGKLKRINYLGDLGVHERIIPKRILKK
jgi:hypothetical protein